MRQFRHPGDLPVRPLRWEGRPPRRDRMAKSREAEAAAKEGGERYRRAHLRRLGAIVAAVWTMAGLMLLREAVSFFIAMDRVSGL